jgi:Uma2 family endonuclease
VLVDAPESLLEERRSLGLDVFDEVWEGVLHMVPPPGGPHQRLGMCLARALGPAADRQGLFLSHETGLFAAADDYRVPDLSVYRPEHASDRGIDETAAMVVELRSPRDESYDKLDWYAVRGVTEALIIDPPTRAVERYALRGGAYRLVQPDAEGMVTSEVLGVRLGPVETPESPCLRIEDGAIITDC